MSVTQRPSVIVEAHPEERVASTPEAKARVPGGREQTGHVVVNVSHSYGDPAAPGYESIMAAIRSVLQENEVTYNRTGVGQGQADFVLTPGETRMLPTPTTHIWNITLMDVDATQDLGTVARMLTEGVRQKLGGNANTRGSR